MRTISCLRDMERDGIVVLTGEADAMSYRLLCDLTRNGVKIVCEALSIKAEGLQPSWNSGSKQDPHVASILLTCEAWEWLAPVALYLEQEYDPTRSSVFTEGLRPKYHKIFCTVSDKENRVINVVGLEADDMWENEVWEEVEVAGRLEFKRIKEALLNGCPWPSNAYGRVGRNYLFQERRIGSHAKVVGEMTRNTHAMSQRTV